jgi:hypothetical protein
MPVPAQDFSFLSEDIKRQQEIAQEEAKRLETLLNESTTPAELKPKLEQTKNSLLRVARGLAANATHTSSSAITTKVVLPFVLFFGIALASSPSMADKADNRVYTLGGG